MNEEMHQVILQLQLELRRGTQVLSVLSQLHKPMYGYSLVESLQEKGVDIEPGTLYPMLRRLEKQGLLQSEWETTGSKPRKYYVQSQEGQAVYQQLKKEWNEMSTILNNLLKEREI